MELWSNTRLHMTNSCESKGIELIRDRILTKGVRAEDIKHQNRLTDDQIADLPINLVFEWIKTGKWSYRDFNKWLKTMRVI